VLHGILQVLHNSLLADHFFNLPLVFDIKGVVIQSLNLSLPFHTLSLLSVLAIVKYLGKASWVVHGRGQLRVLSLELRPHCRLTQNLKANKLGVLFIATSSPGLGTPSLLWNACAASHVTDVQSQHVPILDLVLLHRLGIVGD
jgi:hypothetical protein